MAVSFVSFKNNELLWYRKDLQNKKKQQQMLYSYFLDNKCLLKHVVVPTLGTRIPDFSLITHFMKYIKMPNLTAYFKQEISCLANKYLNSLWKNYVK